MLQPTRLISTPFAQEGNKTEIQNVTGEFDNLIIPVGSSYKLENGDAGGTATILKWYELR